MSKTSNCDICGRRMDKLTRHHLIPRTRHKNKRNKKNFSREEVHQSIIYICGPCHRNIHAHLTEKELEYSYNSIEKLLSHPEIRKFTDWIKDKPDNFTIRVRDSKNRSK